MRNCLSSDCNSAAVIPLSWTCRRSLSGRSTAITPLIVNIPSELLQLIGRNLLCHLQRGTDDFESFERCAGSPDLFHKRGFG